MKIVLTGFMGTGKTAIGSRLAERLGLSFVDLDRLIEAEAGITIAEIFASEGEPGFRRRERELIATFADRRDCVIATGGGAVLDAENLAHLKTGGILICLRADPEVIVQRIGTDDCRPLLHGPDRLDRIRELLNLRASAYSKADLSIDTSRFHVEEIVDQVVRRLGLKPVGLGERGQ